MVRLDWQQNSIKFLSVLLAFILWIYANNEQNPVKEKILNVNLERTGLVQNFLITGGMPESVKVKVLGNNNQLANLTPGDIKAVVDIPEGVTGEILLPVQVSAPAGLRLAQVTPEEVRLSIDLLVEKEIPVVVSLRGAPAQGYTALTPVCHPGTVIASGPGKVVNEIIQATAVVEIPPAVRDIEQNYPVNVGNSSVSLNPSMVHVVIPIVSAVSSKIVPVQIQLTGVPANGYTIKGSVAEPVSVQIFGPAEALSEISGINTEPVDIHGIDKNLAKDVGLIMPPGVTNFQPGRVKVQVEVVKKESPVQPPPGNSGEPSPQKP
ncbi:MAG: YbbR-like protein [Pelotomaculum sp. PtaU1.Bin035]|nr:MAG: YbbR-like protein [Pelotomaculum sp. PtaU1.Bin035]